MQVLACKAVVRAAAREVFKPLITGIQRSNRCPTRNAEAVEECSNARREALSDRRRGYRPVEDRCVQHDQRNRR